MTPVFAHGQLRLYLLSLLEQGPRHGYELITALSDRFGGTYRPSPGTISPRLARLEEEGLVRRSDDGGRRSTYTLTDSGRAELDARRGDLAELEESLAETVRELADQVRDDVRGAMRGLRADLAAAAQSARASASTRPSETGAGASSGAGAGEGSRASETATAGSGEDAGEGDRSPSPEERVAARIRLAEVEAQLRTFRDELRTELRAAARGTGGTISELTVETVRTVLDQASTAIRATLR